MSSLVDFLPASYRERLVQRRSRRERIFLSLLVFSGLVGTDLLFRHRIATVHRMEQLATLHADTGQQRSIEEMRLQQRADDLRAELTQWTAPLCAPKASAILDELVANRPDAVQFRTLQCRIDPWSPSHPPWLLLEANSADLDEFSSYLAAIQGSDVLPPLFFRKTGAHGSGGEQTFRIETQRRGR